MSSIHSHIAQPKTRKFVNTQSDNDAETGPYLFSQSDIDSFVAAYSNVSQVGSVITVTGNFNTTVANLNSFDTFSGHKTLTDMGATVYIGNGAQSELIVLRLVQLPALAADCNSSLDATKTAYVVVENNCTDVTASKLQVYVARV